MIQLNLAVRFIADGDRLEKIELGLAPMFSPTFEGVSSSLKKRLSEWLESYLAGKPKPFALPQDETPFQQQVIDSLIEIPFGSTLSYSEVAEKIGNPKAARAVGNACGNNQLPLLIPCHRVIQKNGKLGGFALDLEIKKHLLLFEKNDCVF